jgi:hypothetical protein
MMPKTCLVHMSPPSYRSVAPSLGHRYRHFALPNLIPVYQSIHPYHWESLGPRFARRQVKVEAGGREVLRKKKRSLLKKRGSPSLAYVPPAQARPLARRISTLCLSTETSKHSTQSAPANKNRDLNHQVAKFVAQGSYYPLRQVY